MYVCIYIYIYYIYIYIYIVIKKKTNNIFRVKIFRLLPLCLYQFTIFLCTIFFIKDISSLNVNKSTGNCKTLKQFSSSPYLPYANADHLFFCDVILVVAVIRRKNDEDCRNCCLVPIYFNLNLFPSANGFRY